MRRHLLVALSVVVVGLAALFVVLARGLDGRGPGDGSADSDAPAPRTDRLIAAVAAAPEELDPHLATAPADRMLHDNIHETLVRADDDLSLIPGLATTWRAEDDARTWVLELREDARFHDGSPVRARDVVASLERIARMGTESHRLAAVADVEALDEHTVEIALDHPLASLPAQLAASSGMAVLPSSAVQRGEIRPEVPGAGPFRRNSASADETVLTPAPDHWAASGAIDELVLRAVPDEGARLDALLEGAVDWIDAPPVAALAEIDEADGLALGRAAGLEYWYLALDHGEPPFDAPEPRRALAHAIDRDALTEAVRGDTATPTTTPLPPASAWHLDGSAPDHDPDRARQLLEEAGVEELEIELLATEELPESVDAAVAIAEQLAEIDVAVEVTSRDLEGFLRAQAEGEFDAFVLGWRSGIDPDDALFAAHHSTGERNHHGFRDEEVDAALEAARRTVDGDERRGFYATAQRRILRGVSYVHLYHPDVLAAWSTDLAGHRARPDGHRRLAEARLER